MHQEIIKEYVLSRAMGKKFAWFPVNTDDGFRVWLEEYYIVLYWNKDSQKYMPLFGTFLDKNKCQEMVDHDNKIFEDAEKLSIPYNKPYRIIKKRWVK